MQQLEKWRLGWSEAMEIMGVVDVVGVYFFSGVPGMFLTRELEASLDGEVSCTELEGWQAAVLGLDIDAAEVGPGGGEGEGEGGDSSRL